MPGIHLSKVPLPNGVVGSALPVTSGSRNQLCLAENFRSLVVSSRCWLVHQEY
jgi:hypothetical protein